MSVAFRLALVLVYLLVGCAPTHLRLEAPPAAATLETRYEAYRQLRPVGFGETHVRSGHRHEQFVGRLELASGWATGLPEDLMPVMHPDSPAMDAAERSLVLRTRRRRMGWVTLGAVLGGITALALGGAASRDDNSWGLVGGTVGATSLGLAGAMAFGRRAVKRREEREQRETFLGYDAALRARLEICGPHDTNELCGPYRAPTVWEPSPDLPASAPGGHDEAPPSPWEPRLAP